MKDFWYLNPTKIIFGCGKINEVADYVKEEGNRALLVYGKSSIKDSGLYDQVKSRLSDSGISIVEHGGVCPNPRLSHARAGVEIARKSDVDCVLAIGGGSVIDEAKVIAYGALTEKDLFDYFLDKSEKPQRALPIIAAVTLAGTGTELNTGAILTNDANHQKMDVGAACLAPTVSILDPELTKTVSRKNTVYGAVDALSHLMEGYFNTPKDVSALVQRNLTEGLMKSIFEITPKIIKSPENTNYRAESMWAACWGNTPLFKLGMGKIVYEIHCIAHAIGGLFDAPHGAAISAAIPGWMNFRIEKLEGRLAAYASNVLMVNSNTDKAALARKAVDETIRWFEAIGAPVSMTDLNLGEREKNELLEDLIPKAVSGGINDVSPDDVRRLVDLMF
ncbi:MAG: iron-containing alcohol dehydrogenase [Proteobacteria bacterium]|nr:iron-containing alcohol dehydrogenase [Pseudomonadota bacterium]